MNIYALQKRLKAIKHSRLIWMAIVLAVDVAIAAVMAYTTFYAIFEPSYSFIFFAMTITMAVLTLMIPYIFGEKSVKKMALFGLLIFVVAGMVFGLAYLNTLFAFEPDPSESKNGVLTQGTVAPLHGASNSNFTFEVFYDGPNSHADMSVRVNVSDTFDEYNYVNKTMALKAGSNGTANERYYTFSTTLKPSVYQYRFECEDSNGTTVTMWNLGPLNEKQDKYTAPFLLSGVLSILSQVAIVFFLGLLMYWWLRRGRIERAKWASEGMDRKTVPKTTTSSGFTCTSCGADVDDDDKFCPKCGEKFEDEPKEVKPVEFKSEEKPAEPAKETSPKEGEGKK